VNDDGGFADRDATWGFGGVPAVSSAGSDDGIAGSGPGSDDGIAGSGPGSDDGIAARNAVRDDVTGPGQPGPAEAMAAEDKAAPAGKQRSFWRELPVLVVMALVIALLIKTFVVQAFFIPSSSMEDTLLIGDKVLVNKLVYHFRKIEPGDIVVFSGAGSWGPALPSTASSDPLVRLYDATLGSLFHSIAGLFGTPVDQAGTDFIKRVIGVPGDHVACCNAQGLVTVNGVPLHEQSYLFPGARPGDVPAGYSGHFSITVPPGRLWVMGDNRAVSDDSRLRQGDPGRGTIPESAVIGRAFLIVWPPDRWRVLPIPATFSQPGIDSPRSAAGAAPVPSAATSDALLRGVPVASSVPYLPLAAGFAAALPLTWLQRRIRLRDRHRG
jgi:signal peptidase I